MERHNWNVSKYNRSEFILFFFPSLNLCHIRLQPGVSDFHVWFTNLSNEVWKQNKCLLGHDFSVTRTYRLGKKTVEKAGCACEGNEFVISWTVRLPLASWWDGESREVSCVSSIPLMFLVPLQRLWLLAYSYIWSTKSEDGTAYRKRMAELLCVAITSLS